jgi:hypothetical protein
MKAPQTFEERHAKALEKAHADLRRRLRSSISGNHMGLGQDDFISSASVYAHVMGYVEAESEPMVYPWLDAVEKAWRMEVREKGDRMVLADVLDRAIRDSTIAIGKPWPEEESGGKRAP